LESKTYTDFPARRERAFEFLSARAFHRPTRHTGNPKTGAGRVEGGLNGFRPSGISPKSALYRMCLFVERFSPTRL
jgi:hypothetical protein